MRNRAWISRVAGRDVSFRALGRARAVVLLLLAAGLSASTVASAGKVRGKLENWRLLSNPVWEDAKSPTKHGFSFREAVPTVRAEFRRLFPHIPKELCIAAIGSTPQKPPPPILIRIGGGRTTPVTIVVPPGTQLSFQNTDPFKHRVYGVGIKSFQAADTIRGANRDWTVPSAGTFEIRDELAPSLRMWVIGEPNVAAIAYPSLKGEFVLSPPAAGDYTIVAYFAGKKVGTPRPVTADARDVDISAQPIKVAAEGKRKDDGDDAKKKSE